MKSYGTKRLVVKTPDEEQSEAPERYKIFHNFS